MTASAWASVASLAWASAIALAEVLAVEVERRRVGRVELEQFEQLAFAESCFVFHFFQNEGSTIDEFAKNWIIHCK